MTWKGTTFYLSEGGNEAITPKTIGVETGEEFKRANPSELEAIYFTDPTVFNGVNIYTEVMLACKPEIICSNKTDSKYMERFRKRTKFNLRVLPKIAQSISIYGNSWHEIAYDSNSTKDKLPEIVRLPVRDPKYMDFRRQGMMHRIKFDKFGEPESYVEYLEFDLPKQPKEIMQIGRRCVEFPKDKIMHTVFLTVGDSFNGIGLIEPLYNAARAKRNAEAGFTHSIHRLGYPLIGLKVGTEGFYPTPDKIDKAVEGFKDIDETSVVGYPSYVEPVILESKSKGAELKQNIGYFTSEEITALGLPVALVTGAGEGTNRSVLDNMLSLFYQRIDMFQQAISSSLEDQVFQKIYEQQSMDSVPRLEWKESSIDSLMSKSERIERYIKTNALTPNEELEDLIREWERLPKRKKDSVTD